MASEHECSTSQLPQNHTEKLSQAYKLKEEGNQLFKKEDWRKAAKKYHFSLMYVKGLLDTLPNDPMLKMLLSKHATQTEPQPEITPQEKEDATKLLITLSNNLAACMLKTQQWENAIKHSSLVLEHEPQNVKALYRRGTAHLNLGRLDDSEVDLKNALQLDPTDLGVKKQYAVLKDLIRQYRERERNIYHGMFSSSGIDDRGDGQSQDSDLTV